jgi:hypothetical protein
VQGSRCRSCGAEILWTVTENGKAMPLDAKLWVMYMVPTGELDTAKPHCRAVQVRTPHWANCPQAASWRGKR